MTPEEAFASYIRTGAKAPELRAASEGSNSAGGYLVPSSFLGEFWAQLKAYSVLAGDFHRVETDHGRPLPAAGRALASAGAAVSENVQITTDADMTVQQITLNAFSYRSARHKVSWQLLQDEAIGLEAAIAAFAAESIGRALSPLSVSGTGGGTQPQGVITAANAQGAATLGTTSGGFVNLTAAKACFVDGATVTELAGNVLNPATLRSMMRAVDTAYKDENCKWYFNPAQLAQLRGLQINANATSPLLLEGDDEHPSLWGFDIVEAPEVPDLTLSTTGGPVFGNLDRGMFWRDAGLSVLRVRETFADQGMVAFIGWQRADFQVRDARAFCTVKPAAT